VSVCEWVCVFERERERDSKWAYSESEKILKQFVVEW
jgi:hypothetical protein